ncbi:MAG: glycosyltransferase [Endomicrobiales bacterium]|nr:glycosyltransferase [Endomicrobiales bacterium]
MKILFLTPYLPDNPDEIPYKARPYYWLKHLSKNNEIHLVSFIDNLEQNKNIQKLNKFCSQIVTVLRKPKSGLKYRLKNILENNPYFIFNQFKSNEMRVKIDNLLKNNKYDAIQVCTKAMAQYVLKLKEIPKFIDVVDCGTRFYMQQWKFNTGLRNRILSFIDWHKVRKYEPYICSKFNSCFLSNPADRDFLKKLNPELSIEIVTHGTNLEYFKPETVKEDFPSLMFYGNMDYTPNNDAMISFCTDVFNTINTVFPDIRLYITGKGVSEKLRKLASNNKNILLTGYVDDIRNFIAKSSIIICPLRIGTGIKTKVLEAMAMGKSVVSSSIGAEGINATPDQDIMVADKPKEFVDTIIKLINDSKLRSAIGANARKSVECHHNWDTIGDRLIGIYNKEIGLK